MERYVFGRISVIPSILGLAIWLWVLDLLNLDVWAAERIGRFIRLVLEIAR